MRWGATPPPYRLTNRQVVYVFLFQIGIAIFCMVALAISTTSLRTHWYLADSKLISSGLTPWVSLRQTVPASLSLRVFDESSDFFKTTGDILMTSHIWYGFGLALPHAIRLVRGL